MATTLTRKLSALTMPCDLETRRETPERRAAWHSDCPRPDTCKCPAHDRDAQATR